ncbi:hypothetical protein [Vallitalea maricola]|uniref:Uncharacterized protein n=1 Tax=Vallitalea maricola TaxID=3074433 RepID=A0ACB5UQJ8_9FIRM|nr:hypothetical protein AN2V17_45120 [Vallitalea sp. AN17-2]
MNEQLLQVIQEELHQYEVDDIKIDIIIDILDRLTDEGYSDKL